MKGNFIREYNSTLRFPLVELVQLLPYRAHHPTRTTEIVKGEQLEPNTHVSQLAPFLIAVTKRNSDANLHL